LEQALHGLQPLITIDVRAPALLYANSDNGQTVEDASMVQVTQVKPRGRRASTKATPKAKSGAVKPSDRKRPPETEVIPKTGAALWTKALGRKKLSLDECVTVALGELALGEDSRGPLKSRASAWLHTAVKSGTVTSAKGRDGNNRYQVVRG